MKYFALATFILLLNKGYCQLAVDKDFIDFGVVSDIDFDWRDIRIMNTSASEAITIHSIVSAKWNSAFRLDCPESLNCADYRDPTYAPVKDFTLLPGKSVVISVAYYKGIYIKAPTHISDELLLRYELQDHPKAGTLIQKISLVAFVIPPVIFVTDTLHLGVVNQGDSVTGTYYFTNNSYREQGWNIWMEQGSPLAVNYPRTIKPNSRDSVVIKLKTDKLCDHINGVFRIVVESSKTFAYYDLWYEVTIVNVKNYAAAEFETEKIYRKMPVNGDGIYVFHFKNTGNIPYIISNCRSSCGCLAPGYYSETVMPGESGVIKAHYDTSRLGEFVKTLTIVSNDRYAPERVLQVSGHVGD